MKEYRTVVLCPHRTPESGSVKPYTQFPRFEGAAAFILSYVVVMCAVVAKIHWAFVHFDRVISF